MKLYKLGLRELHSYAIELSDGDDTIIIYLFPVNLHNTKCYWSGKSNRMVVMSAINSTLHFNTICADDYSLILPTMFTKINEQT